MVQAVSPLLPCYGGIPMIRSRNLTACLGIALAAALVWSGVATAQATKTKPKPTKPGVHTKPVEYTEEGGLANNGWKVTISVNSPDKTYGVGEQVVVKVTSEKNGF